jgi:hypothetical protein
MPFYFEMVHRLFDKLYGMAGDSEGASQVATPRWQTVSPDPALARINTVQALCTTLCQGLISFEPADMIWKSAKHHSDARSSAG